MGTECPDCETDHDEDYERPWQCPECGSFWPTITMNKFD